MHRAPSVQVWQILTSPPSASSYFSLNNYLSSAQVGDKQTPFTSKYIKFHQGQDLSKQVLFTVTFSEQTASSTATMLEGHGLVLTPHQPWDLHRLRNCRGEGKSPEGSPSPQHALLCLFSSFTLKKKSNNNPHLLPHLPHCCTNMPHDGTGSQGGDTLRLHRLRGDGDGRLTSQGEHPHSRGSPGHLPK